MPIKGSWFLTGIVMFGTALLAVFVLALLYAAGDAISGWLKFRAAQHKAVKS